jgi:hypothetical protein
MVNPLLSEYCNCIFDIFASKSPEHNRQLPLSIRDGTHVSRELKSVVFGSHRNRQELADEVIQTFQKLATQNGILQPTN